MGPCVAWPAVPKRGGQLGEDAVLRVFEPGDPHEHSEAEAEIRCESQPGGHGEESVAQTDADAAGPQLLQGRDQDHVSAAQMGQTGNAPSRGWGGLLQQVEAPIHEVKRSHGQTKLCGPGKSHSLVATGPKHGFLWTQLSPNPATAWKKAANGQCHRNHFPVPVLLESPAAKKVTPPLHRLAFVLLTSKRCRQLASCNKLDLQGRGYMERGLSPIQLSTCERTDRKLDLFPKLPNVFTSLL